MLVEDEEMPVIGVLAINPDVEDINVKLPYKEHGNVGWDLCSVEDVEIQPRQRELIDTGLVCDFPDGLYGLIWPRSGLAVKNGIDVLAGCIDTIYRGRIKVALINHSDEIIVLPAGSKVAQMLIQKEVVCEFKWVSQVNNTTRGSKGFGSSGL
jgi:dUTP pyrophosphatase